MSNEYISDVNLAQTRMSVGSLRKNPSNYQVFSFYISMGFLFGVSVLVGSLVAIQTEDQQMSSSTLSILVAVNIAVSVILFFSYTTYIRNIGKYVHGRIKPINPEDNCASRPTGFSPTSQTPQLINRSTPQSSLGHGFAHR